MMLINPIFKLWEQKVTSELKLHELITLSDVSIDLCPTQLHIHQRMNANGFLLPYELFS
jgi:hypothetical protein